MPKSTSRSSLGLAKEATPGTALAPTVFVPVTGITPKDNVTQLEDKAWRGSMVDAYGVQAGPISGELSFDGDVFPDTVGYLLRGILGDLTETGSASPYSHTFALLNSGDGQPPTYSLTDFYAAGTRVYAGAKFSELDFKLSPDALLTYSAKATTYGSATATTPTPAYSDAIPLAAWRSTVSINGALFSEMTDAEIDIKRTVTVVKAVDGTQGPFSLWAGAVAVDGKATLVMEDDTYLSKYLTAASNQLTFDLALGDGSELTFQMSNAVVTAADITRGKDYIELPISFKAYANTTDVGASAGYGPLVVTLKNAIATGSY